MLFPMVSDLVSEQINQVMRYFWKVTCNLTMDKSIFKEMSDIAKFINLFNSIKYNLLSCLLQIKL